MNKLYNGLLGKPTYEELVRENERLRKAIQTIPRNSLSCHIETHLNNALQQHKESGVVQAHGDMSVLSEVTIENVSGCPITIGAPSSINYRTKTSE